MYISEFISLKHIVFSYHMRLIIFSYKIVFKLFHQELLCVMSMELIIFSTTISANSVSFVFHYYMLPHYEETELYVVILHILF